VSPAAGDAGAARPLRVLLVEDDPLDAALTVRTLERAGYDLTWERVQSRAEMEAVLREAPWDVVLSDHSLPAFDALGALRTLQDLGVDIPFIVVSGTMTEEIAASTMRAGARDFIVKGRLARLAPAIERELLDAETRRAQRAAERAQREAEVRMATVVTSAADAIFTVDEDGTIESANPATVDMFGWPLDALVGRSLADLLAGSRGVPVPEVGAKGREVTGRRRDGSTFPLDLALSEMHIDDRRLLVGIARDLTERATLEQRLEQLQHQDPVTGLPNRDRFVAFVDELAAAAEHDARLQLVAIEVDRLRLVSDSLGPAASDQLLLHLAERLRALTGTGEVVARVDTGVFAVARVVNGHAASGEPLAARCRDALREPVPLGTTTIYPLVRAATATAEPSPDCGHSTLAEALAMLELGEEAVGSTSTPARDHRLRNLLLESELHEAVRTERFLIAFQPEIDLRTGRMVAVEALARWTHPRRGVVSPGTFIPLAERVGLIVPLGAWVLQGALEQLARWRAMPGGEDLVVAVNVSGVQLARADLVPMVRGALEHAGLPGEALCLEVTESVLLRDLDRTVEALSALRDLGVHVAIDDFGTGYSSLGTLKHLPVHSLKVDRSFVDALPTDRDDVAIVEALLGMSRALGLTTVAEGVERTDQLRMLQHLGCGVAQGFLLSPPVLGADIDGLLGRHWLDPAA